MVEAPVPQGTRSRQACEPCRRKKIKCTAEKPVCSCCQRLGQTCVYRTRVSRPARTANVRKPSSLRDKFSLLESQVQSIYGILQPAARHVPDVAIQNDKYSTDSEPQESLRHSDNTTISGPSPSVGSSYAETSLDPLPEVLDHAINVYRTMIHLQPLPLFRPRDLSAYLTFSPPFLLYSLLALTLSFEAHTAHHDKQPEAAASYAHASREIAGRLALQGVSNLEVIQSLCLLALRDILACKPNQAQMTIGTASRLEACRSLVSDAPSDPPVDRDLSLRCRWSVYILEKIFSPRLYAFDEDIRDLDFPSSAPVPQALPSARHEDYPSDLYSAYDAKEDFGITAYYIKMVSVSGDVSSWLHHIRLAKDETPWSPESTYARLITRIYEYDSRLPANHLLRNVAFSKRSAAEVLQQREYWTPWVLMQVECHAYLSILNHPFIHLAAVRSCSKGFQSGIFLQQTVDSALFHSGWVFRFLRLCDDHQLELSDPVIGHLVATVATIPWLLQFVEDREVSQQATQDLDWCKSYLVRMSTIWPHVSQKLEVLQNLQLIADHYRYEPAKRGRPVTFPPSLLWELLDPEICHMGRSQRPPTAPGQVADAEIQMTTHLTHPLAKPQTNQSCTSDSASNPKDPFSFGLDDLEQMYMDDLFTYSMADNM